jgi:hypothetical protein
MNWWKRAARYQDGQMTDLASHRANCYGCGRMNVAINGNEWMKKRTDPAGWRCSECTDGKKFAVRENSPPVDRDRSFTGDLISRNRAIRNAKDRLGTIASAKDDLLERMYARRGECSTCGLPNIGENNQCRCKKAEVDPNVGTNFSNWFNSSTANGDGTLDHLNKKKKKSPYRYVSDPDDYKTEPTEDYC